MEEYPNQAGIHIDGKNLSISLTRRSWCPEVTIVGSKDNQQKHLEDMYRLLKEYAETFPWETELKDRAELLLGHVPLEKETAKKTYEADLWEIVKELEARDFAAPYEIMGRNPCPFCKGVNDVMSNFHHESTCVIAQLRRLLWHKQEPAKKQETYCFGEAIDKARKYSSPSVITNGRIVARCQFAEGPLYILFENRECIGLCRNTDEIVKALGIDVSKGWRAAGEEDTRWANSRSMILLEDSRKKSAKKQEESTALFDIIGKAVLEHSSSTFTANSGNLTIAYLVRINRWNITDHDEYGSIFHEFKEKEFVETFAKARKIDISKGWRITSTSGGRG